MHEVRRLICLRGRDSTSLNPHRLILWRPDGHDFTHAQPDQVRKLVRLAAALTRPDFASRLDLHPVPVPLLTHGRRDNVVAPEPVRAITESIFMDLSYILVDNDHSLQKTFEETGWDQILE